jgi:hypothetical protein
MKLVSLRGHVKYKLSDYTDEDIGFMFWGKIAQNYPGIKWSDIQNLSKNNNRMGAKWYEFGKKAKAAGEDIYEGFGEFFDGIGDKLGDVAGKIGEMAGDAVRLMSDPEVVQAVASYADSYAKMRSGGMSESGFLDFFKKSGAEIRKSSTGFDGLSMPIVLGGIGIIGALALILPMISKKKSQPQQRIQNAI